MADGQLGNHERAALFALLAESRPLSNVDLKTLIGSPLTKNERIALVDRKLITAELIRQAFTYELTDAGWRWCAEEMTEPKPPKAFPLGAALYAILPRLKAFLDRTDLSLADVFGTSSTAAPSVAASIAPARSVDVESRIRAAYAALASTPHEWIGLAALRDRLGDLPRDDVDGTLIALGRTSGVHLASEDDQKSLTQRDRDAALRVGGRDNHLLAMAD